MAQTEKLRPLIELLMQATKARKLTWEPSSDLTSFWTTVGGGTVELLQHPAGDGFNLVVKNNLQFVVEETGYMSTKASPDLAELVREVRSHFSNADDVLNGMISGLRQITGQ